MNDMTQQRWAATEQYIRDVFGGADQAVASIMPRARQAGLPDIAVSPDTGRLLRILASLTNAGRGAELALELGTLAGYSAQWIAGGLSPTGRLITLEPTDRHADFASAEFTRAGLAKRIEVRRATARDEFPRLSKQFGPDSFDFIFADAVKKEYESYFEWARIHLKPGGVFTAHNALGSNSWWIDRADDDAGRADRNSVDRFNRRIAADVSFESIVVPMHQGLLIARKRPPGG